MPNGIPVWVTTIVPLVTTIVALTIIIVVAMVLALPRVVDKIAQRSAFAVLAYYGQQVAEKRKEVFDMEAVHAEAHNILKTVAAFELDETLPLKLRQQATGLRTAELLYGYEQAVASLRRSYKDLAAARNDYNAQTDPYWRKQKRSHVDHLTDSIAEQEAAIAKMEPELERYGAAYEKLTRNIRAV